MPSPLHGPLANPLTLALPSGEAVVLLAGAATWAWTPPAAGDPPFACPSVDLTGGAFSLEWLDEAAHGRALVELRGQGGASFGSARLMSYTTKLAAGVLSVTVDLALLPGRGDLQRYLREPLPAVPLSADELGALAAAVASDAPDGLIPRLLATLAAERAKLQRQLDEATGTTWPAVPVRQGGSAP